MAIMAIIMGPIIDSIVSGMNAQAQQLNVAIAQQQARMALERMRRDIHCAHGVQSESNGLGGETLILTETNTTGTAECPGLIVQNVSAVEWCTIPVNGSTDRYQLFRDNNPANLCDSGTSTFEVDYITEPDLWTIPACTGGEFPTVGVSLPVNVDPSSTESGSYNLGDQIALRNGTPCS